MSSAAPIQLDYQRQNATFRIASFILGSILLAAAPFFDYGVSLALWLGLITSFHPLYPLLNYSPILAPVLVLLSVILLGQSLPRLTGRSRTPYFVCISLAVVVLILDAAEKIVLSWSLPFRHAELVICGMSGAIGLLETVLYAAAWIFLHRLAQQTGRVWLKIVTRIGLSICMLDSLFLLALYAIAAWMISMSYRAPDWFSIVYRVSTTTLFASHCIFWTTLAIAAPRLARPKL